MLLDTQKNRLNETVLLRTQNTCLILVRKNISTYKISLSGTGTRIVVALRKFKQKLELTKQIKQDY